MIKAYWDIEVKDKDGKVLEKGRHEARSFLANFDRILKGIFSAPGGTPPGAYTGLKASADVLDETGTSTTIYTEWYASGTSNYSGGGTPVGCNAGDDDDTYGIIPGTGTTPVDIDNYAPDGKISHGTGAGQLDYNPTSISDLVIDTSVSPPVARFQLIRTFSNLSGGTININNVSLVARSYWKDSGGVRQDEKYLIARDKLPSTYSVPDGGTATITLTVEVALG